MLSRNPLSKSVVLRVSLSGSVSVVGSNNDRFVLVRLLKLTCTNWNKLSEIFSMFHTFHDECHGKLKQKI